MEQVQQSGDTNNSASIVLSPTGNSSNTKSSDTSSNRKICAENSQDPQPSKNGESIVLGCSRASPPKIATTRNPQSAKGNAKKVSRGMVGEFNQKGSGVRSGAPEKRSENQVDVLDSAIEAFSKLSGLPVGYLLHNHLRHFAPFNPAHYESFAFRARSYSKWAQPKEANLNFQLALIITHLRALKTESTLKLNSEIFDTKKAVLDDKTQASNSIGEVLVVDNNNALAVENSANDAVDILHVQNDREMRNPFFVPWSFEGTYMPSHCDSSFLDLLPKCRVPLRTATAKKPAIRKNGESKTQNSKDGKKITFINSLVTDTCHIETNYDMREAGFQVGRVIWFTSEELLALCKNKKLDEDDDEDEDLREEFKTRGMDRVFWAAGLRPMYTFCPCAWDKKAIYRWDSEVFALVDFKLNYDSHGDVFKNGPMIPFSSLTEADHRMYLRLLKIKILNIMDDELKEKFKWLSLRFELERLAFARATELYVLKNKWRYCWIPLNILREVCKHFTMLQKRRKVYNQAYRSLYYFRPAKLSVGQKASAPLLTTLRCIKWFGDFQNCDIISQPRDTMKSLLWYIKGMYIPKNLTLTEESEKVNFTLKIWEDKIFSKLFSEFEEKKEIVPKYVLSSGTLSRLIGIGGDIAFSGKSSVDMLFPIHKVDDGPTYIDKAIPDVFITPRKCFEKYYSSTIRKLADNQRQKGNVNWTYRYSLVMVGRTPILVRSRMDIGNSRIKTNIEYFPEFSFEDINSRQTAMNVAKAIVRTQELPPNLPDSTHATPLLLARVEPRSGIVQHVEHVRAPYSASHADKPRIPPTEAVFIVQEILRNLDGLYPGNYLLAFRKGDPVGFFYHPMLKSYNPEKYPMYRPPHLDLLGVNAGWIPHKISKFRDPTLPLFYPILPHPTLQVGVSFVWTQNMLQWVGPDNLISGTLPIAKNEEESVSGSEESSGFLPESLKRVMTTKTPLVSEMAPAAPQ